MPDHTFRTTRLAVIGCGAIGQEVLRYFDENPSNVTVVAVLDRDIEKARNIVTQLRKQRPAVVKSLNELLHQRPNVVLEAASPEAVHTYVPALLARGIDVIMLSVSALVDRDLLRRIREICQRTGARLVVPSGAIGGVDLIRAHTRAGLQEIVLETRKRPEALGLSTDSVQTVYEGDIVEAIKRYPRNLNVYMTVLLAAELQYEKIRCRIVADPSVRENVHKIYVKSRVGQAYVEIRNITSRVNPRTSLLAAYSAIEAVLAHRDRLVVW